MEWADKMPWRGTYCNRRVLVAWAGEHPAPLPCLQAAPGQAELVSGGRRIPAPVCCREHQTPAGTGVVTPR